VGWGLAPATASKSVAVGSGRRAGIGIGIGGIETAAARAGGRSGPSTCSSPVLHVIGFEDESIPCPEIFFFPRMRPEMFDLGTPGLEITIDMNEILMVLVYYFTILFLWLYNLMVL
jgi:hypothetical protein